MPKQVDWDERRVELADAVGRVLIEDGVEALTISRVAQASGWSRGVVQYYFKSKDDLIQFAIRVADEAQHAEIGDVIAKTRDQGSIPALREAMLLATPSDPGRLAYTKMWASLFGRIGRDPRLTEHYKRVYQEWRSRVVSLIRDGVASGELRSDLDPEDAAYNLMALTEGLGVLTVIDPVQQPWPQVRSAIDRHLETLVRTPETRQS